MTEKKPAPLAKEKRVNFLKMRHYVGEVEYATYSEALLHKNVPALLGMSDTYLLGTPIYDHLKSRRSEFSSYVVVSGRFYFPKAELDKMIDEYLSKDSSQAKPAKPELAELMEKVTADPELAKLLLEMVK